MEKNCDILIIGAGASGLACAISAGKASKCRICVLERMPRAGKKLLVTGNGRCNLSNCSIDPEHYHGSVDVKALLEEFPDIRPFFSELGLFTVSDDAGRIYPMSNAATSVLDALRFAADEAGAEVLTDSHCKKIEHTKNGFTAYTDDTTINSKSVILTCGGCASPVHGSDGSGFELAESLGLHVILPSPSLCALNCNSVKALDGVRVKCAAQLIQNGKSIKTERGEVQFTKNALSGICIFNLSAVYAGGNAKIKLDLLPEFDNRQTEELLYSAVKSRNGVKAEDCFSGIFNRKIALYLMKKIKIDISKTSYQITEVELHKLAAIIKGLDFEITGKAGFSSAQVTTGGVAGSEIDDRFMSKKLNGLFLAGEILDIWGDCGGYNLHFAFASGIKAGTECVKFIGRKLHDKA